MESPSPRHTDVLSDRYRLHRPLHGHDPFQAILAEEVETETWAVVNVLDPRVLADLDGERFLAELRRTALTHKHILPILDCGLRGECLFYSQPYHAAHSASAKLAAHGPAPFHQVLQLLGEVGAALVHAHERGSADGAMAVHRLLLDASGVLITDFGVARALRMASGGAPPQPEDDVRSVASVGLHLLTGRIPPPVATASEEDPYGSSADTPPELVALLGGCLAPDAAGVPSMAELMEQVSRIGAERAALSSGLPRSDRAEGFEILREIGEGGMGVVYLAEQSDPVPRRVALKMIKPGMDTREVLRRFDAELQTLAMLDHPNIAKVYDAGSTERGRPYFAMELTDGIPLTDFCEEHRLRTDERLRLFIRVCMAVQHAHQKGIIHRDLKPSNVLVGFREGQPTPKIIDFGIAKATEGAPAHRGALTRTGQVIGTPAYMSPEQAHLSGMDVDTRSDVYSLGLMLYELLVGHLPFDESVYSDPEKLRESQRTKDPPRPSSRFSALGAGRRAVADRQQTDPVALGRRLLRDLDWITTRALEHDRARRYPTANDLATDLERHLRHEPVSAHPPSPTYRMGKFVRRHRTGVAMGATLATVVSVTLVVMTVLWLRATKAEQQAAAEATVSNEIAAFLVDLFAGADPMTPGEDLTVRDLLQRGAERIDQLGDQPDVQGPLLGTMGRAYRNLGDYQTAAALLEESAAKVAAVDGVESVAYASALLDVAVLKQNTGAYEEAEALIRRALATQEPLLAPNDPEIGVALTVLGGILVRMGRSDEATPVFERAVAILEEDPGSDPYSLAAVLTDLGVLHSRRGDWETAIAAVERAVTIFREGEADVVRLAAALNNLGGYYRNLGRYEDAEPAYRESLAIRERELGPEHADVGMSVHNLGNLLRSLGRYAEADSAYDRAIAVWTAALGSMHPYLAFAHGNLATSLFEQDRLDSAFEHFQMQLEIAEASLGPEHPHVASALSGIGEIHYQRGQFAQADTAYQRAHVIVQAALPPTHPNFISVLEGHAVVLRALGRDDEAQRLEGQADAAQADTTNRTP